MTDSPDYTPPEIWSWQQGNGGRFASINRPVAGATHDKDLPVGGHPLQLYSLATPNGVKVTVMLEGRGSEICSNQVTRARGKRRPVKAGFQLDRRSVREAASLPGSSALGLKRSQAEQGQPVRVTVTGHQLTRALTLALGMPAAQEAAVVQEEAQQVQV